MRRRELAGKVVLVVGLASSILCCPTSFGQGAPELSRAVDLVRATKYTEATQLLLPEQARASSALGHYLLAVCYAHLGDPSLTFSHAIDSLSASPPLDSSLVIGAKALVSWSAVETARPVIRAHLELSVDARGRDSAAQEAARKKRDETIERIKARAKPYVDIETDLLFASAAISCVGTECARASLEAGSSPPETPLPP